MAIHFIIYKLKKAFSSIAFRKKNLFVMEFKRDSVITLYLAGKSLVAIIRTLQHLNWNKFFVSRTIALCIASKKCTKKKKNGNNARNDLKNEGQI